jgi:hypothetical protein
VPQQGELEKEKVGTKRHFSEINEAKKKLLKPH